MTVASHHPIKLTPAERVGLWFRIPLFFVLLILRLIRIWPFRWQAGWPFGRILITSIVTVMSQAFSIRQRMSFLPTTGDVIRAYCTKQNLPLKTTEFDCGPNTPPAAWHEIEISAKAAVKTDKVLVWLHGGGYAASCSDIMHIALLLKYGKAIGVGKILLLEYSLAPEVKYPGQLIQAVTGIQNLITVYDPSNIIIGGDSAGGNLILAVITHIIQPSPYVKPIEASNREKRVCFKGLLLMSPWVTVPIDSQSYHENKHIDILNAHLVQGTTDWWAPKSEIWADFLLTSPEFWNNLPVEYVLVTAGEWEVFRDDILRLAKLMGSEEKNSSKRRLVIGKKEIHDQAAVDCAAQVPIMGSSQAILDWLHDLAV